MQLIDQAILAPAAGQSARSVTARLLPRRAVAAAQEDADPRALLRSELKRLEAGLLSGAAPKPTVLHLVERAGRPVAPTAHIPKQRH